MSTQQLGTYSAQTAICKGIDVERDPPKLMKSNGNDVEVWKSPSAEVIVSHSWEAIIRNAPILRQIYSTGITPPSSCVWKMKAKGSGELITWDYPTVC